MFKPILYTEIKNYFLNTRINLRILTNNCLQSEEVKLKKPVINVTLNFTKLYMDDFDVLGLLSAENENA